VTGPAHYEEAELLLTTGCEYGCPHTGCEHVREQLARAQVHATLALAAATALGGSDLPAKDWDAWRELAATP